MKYYVMGGYCEYMAHRIIEADSEEQAITRAKELWTSEGKEVEAFHWDAMSEEEAIGNRFISYGQFIDLFCSSKKPYWSGGYRYII
jgi:hypothetical protein